MVFTDWFSRFPSCKNNTPIEMHQNIQHVQFNPDHLNVIKAATERGPVHATVYQLTLNRWPDRIQDVPCITHHFWGTRDKLTTEDILLKGNRIYIPQEFYERILHDLHNIHIGIKKMQHLTRAHVYWPWIDTDIHGYVRWCTICTRYKATQAVWPMLPRDIPDRPW